MYAWGDHRRFNSYSGYFRRTFGGRVQKISVDAGFTCPNRDGKIGEGGCTFCNNGAFTPSYCIPAKSIGRQIAEGIEFHGRRYRAGVALPGLFPVFFEYLRPSSKGSGRSTARRSHLRRGGYRHRDAPRLRGRREARLSGGDSARPLRGGRIRHRIDLRRDAARREPRPRLRLRAQGRGDGRRKGVARGGAFHPRGCRARPTKCCWNRSQRSIHCRSRR